MESRPSRSPLRPTADVESSCVIRRAVEEFTAVRHFSLSLVARAVAAQNAPRLRIGTWRQNGILSRVSTTNHQNECYLDQRCDGREWTTAPASARIPADAHRMAKDRARPGE